MDNPKIEVKTEMDVLIDIVIENVMHPAVESLQKTGTVDPRSFIVKHKTGFFQAVEIRTIPPCKEFPDGAEFPLMGDDQEKEATAKMLRMLSKEMDADAVVFMTDSCVWEIKKTAEANLIIQKWAFMSDSERLKYGEKKEAISVTIDAKFGKCMLQQMYKREANGNIVLTDKHVSFNAISGRFTDLLGTEKNENAPEQAVSSN